MKKPTVDFVIVVDELKEEGKIKISPISREANSFDCPKCGNLISPENPDSYSEFGYQEHTGALIQCNRCKARISYSGKLILLSQSASSSENKSSPPRGPTHSGDISR